MKKAQMSLELALIVGFMLLVLTFFTVILSDKITDVQKEKDTKILKDLANVVKSEIDLASIAENGYKRNFNLPPTLSGAPYSIKYTNGTYTSGKFTILTVYYDNSPGNEVVVFLPPKMYGVINKGQNTLEKRNNYIILN